jgi:hypothetical protein
LLNINLTLGQKLTEIFQRPLLGVLLWGFSVHEVVEALTVLQKVVYTTHDAKHAKREDVDTDDGDDGGLTANEPTEDREHGGDDIDGHDSAGKLPGWDRTPEWSVLRILSVMESSKYNGGSPTALVIKISQFSDYCMISRML